MDTTEKLTEQAPQTETSPNETLYVKNFGGIKEATIELSRMNIFIGPEATGKSVVAKLFYFFKEIMAEYRTLKFNSWGPELALRRQVRFLQYFPNETWPKGDFNLTYTVSQNYELIIRRLEGSNVTLNLSKSIQIIDEQFHEICIQNPIPIDYDPRNSFTKQFLLLKSIADEQLTGHPIAEANAYIVASRSLFAIIKNEPMLWGDKVLMFDSFLQNFNVLFGVARRHFRDKWDQSSDHFQSLFLSLIKGSYSINDYYDYINEKDQRKVPIHSASSGQQEVVPLCLVLYMLNKETENLHGVDQNPFCTYIEEPEAHLFPSSQRDVVRMIAGVSDLTSPDQHSQFVITTHSPYILTAINNLMYAQKIKDEFPHLSEAVDKEMNGASLISPQYVRAYIFDDGKVTNIIDDTTKLIDGDKLDDVSGEIAEEFDKIHSMAFKARRAK